MPYKRYSNASADRLLDWWKNGSGEFYSEQPQNMVEVSETGDVDEDVVRRILGELSELAFTLQEDMGKKWGGEFDSAASKIIHETLKLDNDVAADPGFWRWMTFSNEGVGLNLVDLRYKSPSEPGMARPAYYGMGRVKDSMFGFYWLRANSMKVGQNINYELSSSIKAVDFWWSHIIRIDFGSVPAFASAFTKFVNDNELPMGNTNDSSIEPGYRNLAPELTRRNATHAYELMSEDEAYQFIQSVWREKGEWLWLNQNS